MKIIRSAQVRVRLQIAERCGSSTFAASRFLPRYEVQYQYAGRSL